MERYFYFAEPTVETTGEASMYPLSSFLGMTPAGGAITSMRFKARNGELVDDKVNVTHTGYLPKVFMAEVVKYMQRNHRNPFLAISDGTSGKHVSDLITSVAVVTAA